MWKKILFGCFFILELVACSISNPSRELSLPTMVVEPPTTDILVPKATPQPSMNLACWEKEKECAIVKKLGFHIDAIVSFSPDKQWVVVYRKQESRDGKYVGGLRFIHANGDIEWVFSSDQLEQDIGECALFWMTNFWSLDSRYVYFSPDPSYCSRPRNYSAVGTQVLYRLDIQTGEFTEILPFKLTSFQLLGLYTLGFSPDGKSLAYFQTLDSPLIIKIRDLSTNKETIFSLNNNYREAGCLVWTADAQHVLFYVAKNTMPGTPITTSLFMIDMKQQTIQPIYSDQPNIYCPSYHVFNREQASKDKDLVPIELIGSDLGTNYFRMIDRFYLNPFTGQRIILPTTEATNTSNP